ncbi:MAG: hypothetical protein WKG01_41490 [Kofleriaceae bacterium]
MSSHSSSSHPRAAEPGWSAANLTAVAIKRESKTARRRHARKLRRPDITEALHLGVGSLAIPLVGPMAFLHAREQLARIARGEVLPDGRRWIVVALVCSVIATIILLVVILILLTSRLLGVLVVASAP